MILACSPTYEYNRIEQTAFALYFALYFALVAKGTDDKNLL